MQTGTNRTVRKRKLKIILLCILLIAVGSVAFGFLYWNANKNVIIENEIEKAIEKTKDAFYKVSYADLKVDEDAGAVYVSDMNLKYDSTKYLQKAAAGQQPSMLFNINIAELNVLGVKTKKAMLDKEIVGRKLEIRNPVIDLEYTYTGKDAARNIPTEEIYREVLENLDLIQIDSVLITGARVRTTNKKTGKTIIDVKDIDLALLDLRVDSTSYKDSARFFFSKQFNLNIARLVWPSPDKLYDYAVKGISLHSSNKTLAVREIAMLPRLGEQEFVNAMPTQTDRFNFGFTNIVFSGMNIGSLFNEYVEAGALTIGGASLRIYRDLAKPRDRVSRVGKYPHQVMDEIPLRFNIKKVNVRNSYIEYKERNHITRQSGKVRFHNVNGSITNFTNDKRVKNKVMKANLSSSFLNKTPLKTIWTFYLFDAGGRFDVSGNIGAIDGQSLNELAEPMGPATIREGRLNVLSFNLSGNNHSMNGKVKMLYDDLKVAVLEKDKGETELDKKFLTSLLANFVIKNSNPKEGDAVREEQVQYSRNTNRSLFNLCWKTLFTGIRQTVGIKQELATR